MVSTLDTPDHHTAGGTLLFSLHTTIRKAAAAAAVLGCASALAASPASAASPTRVVAQRAAFPGFTFTVNTAQTSREGAGDWISLTGAVTCPAKFNGEGLVVEVVQGDVSSRPVYVKVTCDGAKHGWDARTYTSMYGQQWRPGGLAKVTGQIAFASEEQDIILT
ncbi:hypothetical protein ACFY2H_38880 [Streptomyces griseofuscus]|uniref:hypothetical protein n=1 Tax=Streptomyces griseofuscus TaxID=146922 RepID=UPI0036BD7462